MQKIRENYEVKTQFIRISAYIQALSVILKEYSAHRLGGDKRDRTADLLNAIQALSQLSYTPIGIYVKRGALSISYTVSDAGEPTAV